jgi:hypothetical protein
VYESFILPSKEEGIMSKKTTENVNEDTLRNEIVTSDQLVNAIQGTFSYADPGCTNIYLFCKKNNRRLELIDTVFLSFISIKRR